MKAKKIFLIVSFLFLSGSVYAKCDKWKGEWFSLVWQGNAYLSLFDKYEKGFMGKMELIEKAEEVVAKLERLRLYVEDTESCEHSSDKYENRKRKLLAVIPVAIAAMRTGEFIQALK